MKFSRLGFEGAEKICEKVSGHHPATEETPAAAQGPDQEKQMVSGAIRTDFILSGEIMAIALGTEYRKDTLKSTADASYRSALGGTDSYLSQDVWEANAEVQVPLIDWLAGGVNDEYRFALHGTQRRTDRVERLA